MTCTRFPPLSIVSGRQSPPRFDNLADWLKWQEGLHFTAIEMGLDRCDQVARRMHLLNPDFKVISISGTNGKGSSAAMLDAMLRHAGYKVGAYTSPHLIKYNERICVGGDPVSDEQLCEAFARIDEARGDVSLTYFEFGTLAALDIFHHADIDIALLEVGLGGRLDAVNIVDADVALVGTIDLDHEEWLGYTREHIGTEKAGIFRENRPAICSDPSPPDSIARYAKEIGAHLHQATLEFHYQLHERTWTWRRDERVYENLPKPGVNNEKQVQNAAGVLMVLEAIADAFPVDIETIRGCLRDFRLDGRLQMIPGEIPCILDVAHNTQAISALVENIKKIACVGETHIVIGMLKDKNHMAIFERLSKIADHWYLVDLHVDRAASMEELTRVLSAYVDGERVNRFTSVKDALVMVERKARAGDRAIVTGSFIAVGAAIGYLKNI